MEIRAALCAARGAIVSCISFSGPQCMRGAIVNGISFSGPQCIVMSLMSWSYAGHWLSVPRYARPV
eukprot:3708555-Karenia_brevis.AAC.1